MGQVVRFADIKVRVMATQAKLNAASREGREVNARLLNLLETVEKTLIYNRKKIRRLRRTGMALVLVGLSGWFVAGALVVESMYGVGRGDTADGAELAESGEAEVGHAAPVDHVFNESATQAISPQPGSKPESRIDDWERAAFASGTGASDAELLAAKAEKAMGIDALVADPHDYQGRDVEVTGSVVQLFKRYRLRSETGSNTIVLDIDGIQPSERARLEAAIEKASLLVPVRARINGKVVRQSPADFQLVVSGLTLLN